MNYILGGGISGLIFAFYNKDFCVISPEFGGQMANSFNLGARYLEKTEDTIQFLKDLGINYSEETIKVGYNDGIQFVEFSEDFKDKYTLTSRGKIIKDDNSVLNSSKTEMNILKCDFSEVIKKLKENIGFRLINNEVIKINCRSKELILLQGNRNLRYDKLVSTIPLDLFLKITGGRQNPELESNFVTFVKIKKDTFDMKDFSFAYFINKSFYRMSSYADYLVAEIKGNVSEEEAKSIFLENYLEHKTIRSQVITKHIELNYRDVLYFGRYGKWDKSFKMETAIEEAKKYGKN